MAEEVRLHPTKVCVVCPLIINQKKLMSAESRLAEAMGLSAAIGLAEGGAYPDYKKALTALDYEYADIENRIDNPDFYENKTGYQIYDIIEQIMGSNREASLFLLENGIKGITYEGQQDGRAFVIFNPDDVEVIQKFYQEQSVEQFFSPTNRDKRTYINDLRAAERGEAGNDYNIRLGALPVIYQKIGIENKPVKTKKTIILKDTISKHDVPMNVVENLPELYSNPLVIFKSLSTSTNPDSYVAVLDATDKNGRQMIAALSPSKKENGYHLITSFYGRNNIDNMIRKAFEEGKVKYIRDKKISLLAGHDAYLSQANNNILQKSDIVNSFMQNKPQPQGLYDANRNLIKIFESADFSTLPHELAHYWLNNMWNYTRSGNASERYNQRWNVIANWLGITPEQTLITRRQQEKFARGYEQYLLNGNLPTPIIKGAFDDYDRWLKRVYGDMNNLNVRLSDDEKNILRQKVLKQNKAIILLSAATGQGCDNLLSVIDKKLSAGEQNVSLQVKKEDGKLQSWLYENSEVKSKTVHDEYIEFNIKIANADLARLSKKFDIKIG